MPAPTESRQPSLRAYRSLFLEGPEPCWVVEPETFQLLEVNRKALEVSGYTREEFISQRLTGLIQPWDPDKFRIVFETREWDSPELRGLTAFAKSGRAYEVDLLVRPARIESGEVWQVVLADASQRILLEEQLRQAQKMESVGMLAGGIAHDFNNLLTIISGYSHMLALGLANDPKNKSAAEQIIKAADRAAALTGQLLAFSRRQVLQAKVLDLNTLAHGMQPMLRRLIGEHIDLRIIQGSDLGKVHADSGQIEQIIMNLAVNARDAMPEGGKLLVETRNVDLDDNYFSKHLEVRPGHYVMLAVTDTGIGMDAATRAKVFEPFFTTKGPGQGTGLGLSMILGIVKRSGGAVDVYSEPGRGTTVKVYFPKVDRPETAPNATLEAERRTGWETVLLVEDEEAVRNLVRTSLELEGYRVLVAASGREAMQISKSHSGDIQLLITDLIMPEIHGRDVARRLHRKRPAMAVLYMSGYTDTTLHQTGELEHKLHFIGKPFTPAALAAKVREVLEGGGNGLEHHGAGS